MGGRRTGARAAVRPAAALHRGRGRRCSAAMRRSIVFLIWFDHDQSSAVLCRRGPSTDLLFKSLEHLTSLYTVNDLKIPTNQKHGVVTNENMLTRATAA